MGSDLTPPLRRAAWIGMLAVGIFALMVLFDRSLARCGVDFIVYYEPETVALDRRLPSEDRDDPSFAIRTVDAFDELQFRNPPALMFHADAVPSMDLTFLRAEYARGTVLIGVNLTAAQMAELIEPTIVDVAVRPTATREPFYTVVAKNEDQCNDGLSQGCGSFLVETAQFTGYADLTTLARAALFERFQPFIPTATPTPSS